MNCPSRSRSVACYSFDEFLAFLLDCIGLGFLVGNVLVTFRTIELQALHLFGEAPTMLFAVIMG